LGQVIGHLVQNAMLHAFEGLPHGTVRIEAQADADGWIVVRVVDDGRGIPAADIERVFEPFMTTRMGRGGTGLGLAICRRLAELMGGRVGVDSKPGRGSCFWFQLDVETAAAS
ncbi:ATP-binding protein, partial [Acinetobacter baumannii]